MFKQLILLFCLLILQVGSAQKITHAEAKNIADQLFEAEILSDSGRFALKKQIDLNHLEQAQMFRNGVVDSSRQDLQRSSLLYFCGWAFLSDFIFRKGDFELARRQYALAQRQELYVMGHMSYMPKIHEDTLLAHFYDELPDLAFTQIEKKIPITEPISPEVPIYQDFLLQLSTEIGTELIHEKRSVMGKHRIKTADDLLRLNMISPQVHQELVKKIQNNEILAEFQVVEWAHKLTQD